MAAVTAVLFAVRAITPAWLRGGPERRRSKLPVIFLAMMAALVAAVIGVPQGLSSPSAALAQSSCATPTIELERHAEGFGITFTTEQAGISPTGYRYQYVRSGANYTPSEWVEVSGSGGALTEESGWLANATVSGLMPLTAYSVVAHALCGGSQTSASAATGTVTTEKTRMYSLTLTKDGSPISELAEGEMAILTLTMESASDVYDRDVTFYASIIRADHIHEGSQLPAVEEGEVTVSDKDGQDGGYGVQTLSSGETSVSWTVTAIQDSTAHDVDPADNESPLEALSVAVNLQGRSNGAATFTTTSWDRMLRIRDVSPPSFVQTPATGTVTLSGTEEVHNTLTVTVDAMDANGLTDPVYTYTWHYASLLNDLPLPDCGAGRRVPPRFGLNPNTLVIYGFDIGKFLCVRVSFVDDLGNREFLDSTSTAKIPAGASIEVAVLDGNGMPLMQEVGGVMKPVFDFGARAQAGKVLIADTEGVTYPDLATTPNYGYQWIHWRSTLPGIDGWIEDIAGATGNTYTIQDTDVGIEIHLMLTFDTSPSGTRTTLANEPTDSVQAPPPSLALTSAAPSADAEVHFALTAAVTVIGVTNPIYSYEWYSLPVGSTLNTTAHRIAGATEMTYKPTGADVGKEIVAITRFTDNGGYPLTATSPPIGPVRSSASIVGPRPKGCYINETIHVDTSGMNLQGVTGATTFMYQWVYVDGNGSVTGDATGASSTMQSYTLTVNDAGKYMQVEITFTPTGGTQRTVMANMPAPVTPIQAPMSLKAAVPNEGGSVTLTWGLTSQGSDVPGRFEYRYKPARAGDYTGAYSQDWAASPRLAANARSVVIPASLINGVEYTFEVRSVSSVNPGIFGETNGVSVTYRHAIRECS